MLQVAPLLAELLSLAKQLQAEQCSQIVMAL
jgi:hypothetical protein